MSVQRELLRDLSLAVQQADNAALLLLATAFVSVLNDPDGVLGTDPSTRPIFAALAALIGSEQRDRDRTVRRARLDQANARVPQSGWSQPPPEA